MLVQKYPFPINKKTAILADIHNRSFDISLLEKQNVDIILIPGDLASMHLSQRAYDIAKEGKKVKGEGWTEPKTALYLLKTLPKIAPTFYTPGNHEFYWNEEDRLIIRESGTVLLENDYVEEQGILIGGIRSSAHKFKGCKTVREDAQDFISKFEKLKGQKLLMLHEPHMHFIYGLDKSNIDLVISGHAHGGQWRFFGRGIFAPGQGFFPKYTKGFYGKNLFVSPGMSNTVPVFPRFFNPTELVILENI